MCVQEILNSMLKVSLLQISTEDQLTKIVNLIMSTPWISPLAQVRIYLYDKRTKMLQIRAHYNYTRTQLDACPPISPVECPCGRPESTTDMVFIPTINIESKQSGHYCVPIKSNNRLLGLIGVYEWGKASSGDGPNIHFRAATCNKEMFLKIAANTIAGIALRKEANENLTHNYLIQS
ncbi:MAG: hypothetical protein HQL01_09375 [Nitrospirae bacterium]|nr:hypothetical protein [Nitrospirota bacterium]